MITRVVLTAAVQKRLVKLPLQVRTKLQLWSQLVGELGLEEVRKIRGYHDEPIIYGPHLGQRSVRLGKAYRAFYMIRKAEIEFVSVEEVNKHEYDR
jgi:proteic killer suppression protein